MTRPYSAILLVVVAVLIVGFAVWLVATPSSPVTPTASTTSTLAGTSTAPSEGATTTTTTTTTTTGTAAITLTAIVPAEGSVGTVITLTGSGFTGDNTVLFDGLVASKDALVHGTESLTLMVPSSLAPDCKPGQACPDFLRDVTAGTYAVTVENANGTSNPINFVVN